MRVNKDEVANVRRVNVNLEPSEVARLVCNMVADSLKLDRKDADKHLSVEFNHNHAAYIRGEVPLTREQQLEALGLTPTEPVETEGAAIAEALSDESTFAQESAFRESKAWALDGIEAKLDTSGVQAAATRANEAIEGLRHLQQTVSSAGGSGGGGSGAVVGGPGGRGPVTYTLTFLDGSVPLDEAVDRAGSLMKTLERLRGVVGDPTSPEGQAKLREMVKATMQQAKDRAEKPPAGSVVALRLAVMARDSRLREIRALVESHDKGEYAWGSIRDAVLKLCEPGEDLALQRDVDTEDSRQLEAKLARIAELERDNADAGTWGAAVGARAEELEGLYAEVTRLRAALNVPGPAVGDNPGVRLGAGEYPPDAVRFEPDLGQMPMVPRTDVPVQPIVSAGALYQARVRLAEMLDCAQRAGARRTPNFYKTSDVEYVLALLGGSPWGDLPSAVADTQTSEAWARVVETKPESGSAAAQDRRQVLLSVADRLLQGVLLADSNMSAEARVVVTDAEHVLRKMSR